MSPVHLLVATVPWRRVSCERLLVDIARQSVQPDQVELMLDGYADAPIPTIPSQLSVRAWHTSELSGPGGRWRVVHELAPDTVIVSIDDDVDISAAPRALEALSRGVERGKRAAAASGITVVGGSALWGMPEAGDLLCMNAGAMAVCASDLDGLDELRGAVFERCGFDPLGDLGDDEALISACLWKRGVVMRHVTVEGLQLAQGTQERCQTKARRQHDGTWDKQRVRLREAIGWPWRTG